MLTIGQLAAYAGVTVRAVRHYHQVGLLPEPERDRSGYRTYDATAVVQLIKIRALADAGVPLAHVPELLEASPEEFARAVRQIDQRLREEINRLQRHRREVARLAAGDSLALPEEAVVYLDELRAAGASDFMVEVERDAWILIAARWPERMPELMAAKRAQLEDPAVVRLYRILDDPMSWTTDDPRLVEFADVFAEILDRADRDGELQPDDDLGDPAFVDLLDSFTVDFAPIADRLQELLEERGWSGWSHAQRIRRERTAPEADPF